MRKHLMIFGVIALVLLCLSLIIVKEAPAQAMSSVHLTSPDGQIVELSAEIADTDSERETGLMFRDSVEPATGMLFAFGYPQPLAFWMKNTRIPLDILFFDPAGKFVSRTTMVPCLDDPCATYLSGGPSQYALEVNAGEPATQNIGVGWILETASQK